MHSKTIVLLNKYYSITLFKKGVTIKENLMVLKTTLKKDLKAHMEISSELDD